MLGSMGSRHNAEQYSSGSLRDDSPAPLAQSERRELSEEYRNSFKGLGSLKVVLGTTFRKPLLPGGLEHSYVLLCRQRMIPRTA